MKYTKWRHFKSKEDHFIYIYIYIYIEREREREREIMEVEQ